MCDACVKAKTTRSTRPRTAVSPAPAGLLHLVGCSTWLAPPMGPSHWLLHLFTFECDLTVLCIMGILRVCAVRVRVGVSV